MNNAILAELRTAAQCAEDVYKSLRTVNVTHVEDRFIMDISALVVEAFECMDANTNVAPEIFVRISKYVSADAPTKLLKVGYALMILLRKLLNDRHEAQSKVNYLNSVTFRKHHSNVVNSYTPAKVPRNFSIRRPMIYDFAPSKTAIRKNAEVEVKEEPMEIKEEEIDDYPYVTERVKEEPIADVFCPGTGSARPIDGQFPLEQDPCNFPLLEIDSCNALMENGPCNVNPGLMNAWDLPNDNDTGSEEYPSTSMEFQPSSSTSGVEFPKNNTGATRECYLCGKHVFKFYSTYRLERVRRNKLLNALIIRSSQERARQAALRSNETQAFFCISHVIASRVPGLLPKQCRAPPANPKPELKSKYNHPTVPRTLKCKCDLCDDPEYPIRLSPSTSQKAQTFFSEKMIGLTPEQRSILRARVKKNENARICSKHFRKEVADVEEDEQEAAIPTPILWTEKFKPHNDEHDLFYEDRDEEASNRFAYDLNKMPIKKITIHHKSK